MTGWLAAYLAGMLTVLAPIAALFGIEYRRGRIPQGDSND